MMQMEKQLIRNSILIIRGFAESYSSAKSKADSAKPKYNVGDKFTLYYNTREPKDWRWNIEYASENSITIYAIIIIGFRAYGIIKGIIDYKKEKRDLLKI